MIESKCSVNLSDESVLSELYFLIAHFLKNGPFKDTAKDLITQLEQQQVLPKRIDWTGKEHNRTFEELAKIYGHIPSNFLLQLCNQLRNLFDRQLNINFSQVNTLLGSGQFSVLQDLTLSDKKHQKTSNTNALPKDFYLKNHANNKNYFNFNSRSLNGGANLLLNLIKHQIDGSLDFNNIIQPELFRSINIHKRILGHLSAVYCVCFDRTGRYILTGADDNLIKIWGACDSRLLATLRGHEKEISDIDINYENTLIASGSCDKSIRIWNLRTTECITVLQGHNSMVTSIEFSPYCNGTNRWLASSGNDGTICFWSWDSNTLAFNPKPTKFIEKSRPSGQMLCISFSAGGSFLAAGSNDHAIRVYFFDNDNPIKIGELESHSNLVDSIQYANNSARFLSGSKDGTARIWRYESQQWKATLIDASKTLNKADQDDEIISLGDITRKNSVTMVTWNCDDSLVVTAQNNFLIKIWNSNDAQLVHELKGHSDEIFVLEAHPRDPRLILSAGHDGYVILWNLLTGKMIKKFYNKIENEGHGCLFDTKWSPTMDMFAATDSHGYLTIFGFGSDEIYKKTPNEQFFHTDYRPLMRDSTDFVVDEQTQQPPHLMPPPFLVNADGNPYGADLQRLVPGRENLTDAQLNPHIITNERGMPEIIGEVDPDENQSNQNNNDENAPTTSSRRGNYWTKDLIKPIDKEILKTGEKLRLTKYKQEKDKFYLQHKKNFNIEFFKNKNNENFKSNRNLNNDGNNNKRKRGKLPKNNSDNFSMGSSELVIKNRLFKKALFDTDNEDEIVNDNKQTSNSGIINSENEEETLDDQYIEIDDDSNTQHSTNANSNATARCASTNPTTSYRSNNRNGASNVYYEQMEIQSEYSESSEYSDWAEEDGRKTLKPPPTTTKYRSRSSRNTRRTLKIRDDDDTYVDDAENSNDSMTRVKKTTMAKKLKKIVSDDDEDVAVSKASSSAIIKVEKKEIKEESEDENQIDIDENDDEDEDYDDECSSESEESEYVDSNKPCTSQAANARSLKSPRKRKKKLKNKIKNKSIPNRNFSTRNSKLSELAPSITKSVSFSKKEGKPKNKMIKHEDLKECPAEFRPPEWLTSTKPKKSPYVPQMGDEVVYFRQGHELYVEAVKNNKVYEIDEKSLPWNMSQKVSVQEYCKVTGMKVEIKPPRLVCLKLSVIDPETRKLTGFKFNIKYHDMPHVVDFVILRQIYDRALEKNWRAKDRFRCIIDDVWWIGIIEAKRPFQEEYPNSQFQCLKILWDNGEPEDLSPWDLEPLSGFNARKTKPASSIIVPNSGEGIAVTSEEIKYLLYQPEEDEWPPEGRDAECERILKGLQKIMELSIAENFCFPVDLDSFPLYAKVIDYPVDLSTIKERLENRYYRRVNSIQWDVRKIWSNAAKFNEPKSDIVLKAELLSELLLEFIGDSLCCNPIPIYKRLIKTKKLKVDKQENSDLSDENDNSYSNNNSNNNKKKISSNQHLNDEYDDDELDNSRLNRNKRTQINSKRHNENIIVSNKSKNKAMQHECKSLLEELIKHPDAGPFLSPVDLNKYSDYPSIVSKPIDFGTIKNKMINNEYENDLNKFDADCRLLFQNSKAYNTNKRSQIYGMTLRLNSLYESRIQEIKKNYSAIANYQSSIKSRFGRPRKTRYSDRETKTETFSNLILRSTRQKLAALDCTDLYDDQNVSPNRTNTGISTRSSNKKFETIQSSQLTNENSQNHSDFPGLSKSSNLQDKSFIEENSNFFPQDLDNIEYDINDDSQATNRNYDYDQSSNEPCLNSIFFTNSNNVQHEKIKEIQKTSDSEIDSKTAIPSSKSLNTLSTGVNISKSSKSSINSDNIDLEVDHSQNANMSFNCARESDGYSTNLNEKYSINDQIGSKKLSNLNSESSNNVFPSTSVNQVKATSTSNLTSKKHNLNKIDAETASINSNGYKIKISERDSDLENEDNTNESTHASDNFKKCYPKNEPENNQNDIESDEQIFQLKKKRGRKKATKENKKNKKSNKISNIEESINEKDDNDDDDQDDDQDEDYKDEYLDDDDRDDNDDDINDNDDDEYDDDYKGEINHQKQNINKKNKKGRKKDKLTKKYNEVYDSENNNKNDEQQDFDNEDEDDDEDDEEYDNDLNDEDYKDYSIRNKKKRLVNANFNSNIKNRAKRGRPCLVKNLDNKENDDDYEKSKNNNNSDIECNVKSKSKTEMNNLNKLKSSVGMQRSSRTRTSKRTRKQFSYKEMTSSSNLSSEDDLNESWVNNNKNSLQRKLNKKQKYIRSNTRKKRRFSSSPSNLDPVGQNQEDSLQQYRDSNSSICL